jgi:hypothetical protein
LHSHRIEGIISVSTSEKTESEEKRQGPEARRRASQIDNEEKERSERIQPEMRAEPGESHRQGQFGNDETSTGKEG